MLEELLYIFVAALKTKIGILVFALFCLWIWNIFRSKGTQSVKFLRRFFLFLFIVLIFYPYMRLAGTLADSITQTFNVNYVLLQLFEVSKGMDWANGIIYALFFFVFVLFVLYLIGQERKASKPPPDKPFKMEARIGNIEPPK